MSKKQINTERDAMWIHIVEKETGSRGTYFDVPDPVTKNGTGDGESIFRAYGCNDMPNKNHYKKGSRPHGGRKDVGGVASVGSKVYIGNPNHGALVPMTRKKELAIKNYMEEFAIPEFKARQELRKNPTQRKARKTAEIIANEIAHYSENPKELRKYVAERNEATLKFVDKGSQDMMLDALCKSFMESRKKSLEILTK
tara:strand:- start:88 stop:681 length:594 start_codon:yes stop_codon:yes gene_type:complete